jgi:hypothetical protein
MAAEKKQKPEPVFWLFDASETVADCVFATAGVTYW